MAVDFNITRHRIFQTPVVEILIDGKVAGVIYPSGEKNIRIISAHIEKMTKENGFAGEVIEEDGRNTIPPIPAVIIKFNPAPYIIRGNKIIKLGLG